MSKIQKIILSSLLTIGFLSLIWTAGVALAQTTEGLDLGTSYASSTGLTAKDPRLVVANIVKVVLGFIGTIGVILVIYAGFLWMTAAGNEEKISKAKMILKNSVIGLVIVLSAFAITSFVISNILEATNGSSSGGGGTIDPNLPPGPIAARVLRIENAIPPAYSEGLPRNTVIRFRFNYAVNPETINENFIKVDSDQGLVSGKWQISGQEVYFEPEKKCTSECGEVNCLPESSKVKITVSPEIKPADDSIKPLDCSDGFCELIFITGDGFDCQDPVIVDFQSDGGFCVGTTKAMKAHATDDYRLASFEFFANDQSINYQSSADYGKEWATDTRWAATGQAGDNYGLKVRVMDVVGRDQEKTLSGKILPAHCCNGTKDGDETGIDCGGSCLRCQGAACASDINSPSASCNNNLCGSGFCTQQGSSAAACQAAGYPTGTNACCLCQEKPVITGLSPRGGFCQNEPNRFCSGVKDCAEDDTCNQTTPNAKAGNLVTILGSGFGSTTGTVVFTNNKSGDLTACGVNAWSDRQIIVRVPTGAVSGKVKVTNGSNFTAVSSEDLLLNEIIRPGLCSLSKASGTTNELIDYNGLNFSITGTTTKAFYGNFYNPVAANEPQAISPTLVKARVPSLQNGQVTTFVRQEAGGKAGPASNFLMFDKVVDPRTLPRITDFSPKSGPVGQYVTIYGQGFGSIKGSSTVKFNNIEANYQFPAECASSVWSNNQIVVKLPSGATSGFISVNLADGSILTSESLPPVNSFTVNTNSLTPSICKISPTTARPGASIQVWGEYFRAYDSNTSRFKFSQNVNVTTTNWFYNANGYNSATATLPVAAVSGPVNIVNDDGYSNGLNLKVGSCQANSDCQGQFCCPISSPNGGQCRNLENECYGTSASCTYGWSFTTTDSSSGKCPSNAPICGGVCCEDGQECQNNVCVDHEFLSCNNYHECNGAMYCPNSPGWCSQKAGSTEAGDCTNDYCQNIFKEKDIVVGTGDAKYDQAKNICVDDASKCSLDKNVNFELNGKQVAYQLSCREVEAGTSVWTTRLTSGQCPSNTTEYGEWQLTTNNLCVSNKSCFTCLDKLSCLDVGNNESRCGLPEKVCPSGSDCQAGKCQKGSGSCECCCDINLNKADKTNPGCCAPLTCAGTCGSGTSTDGTKLFGSCSGCNIPNATQDQKNAACNCSGTTGKYCDVTVGDGICRDCAQITDKDQCASSATCCYDAKNNKCRGTGTGTKITNGADAGYCGYYSCSGLNCSGELTKNGAYATQAECQQKCSVVSYQGQTCNLAGTSTGCGYQLCASPLSCRTTAGTSATSTNQADCGTCCCDPANDRCNLLGASLTCWANQGNCTGEKRGLCCGCTKDGDCGSTNGTGCGNNTCCQARPKPVAVYPAPNSDNVCRNSEISVEFDQAMDVKTFTDNLLLIANYGNLSCPAGSQYLAGGSAGSKNWLAKLRQRVVAWFSPRSTLAAPQAGRNYCLIKTDAEAVNNRKIKLSLDNVLESSRQYYLVLIADSDIEDNQKDGLLSLTGIGLNNLLSQSSGLIGGDNWSFGHLQITKGFYSTFTTGSRICQIDSVTVSPDSVLLSDLQDSQTLTAQAFSLSDNGRTASPLTPTGEYGWSWNWSVNNPLVAELTDTNNNSTIVKPKNNKDADTYIAATATVTTDNTGSNTVGRTISGQSAVKVFLCANPWPARATNGSWHPWVDYATNMQLYYCRDGQDVNVIGSDLPGLKFVSTTDAVSPSNKAFYFFRYGAITAAPTNLTATAAPGGGAINLSWSAYNTAVKYKIYYGLRSGQYFNQPIEVDSDKTSVTVRDLINGQNYYFAISAILRLDNESFAETALSSEVQKTPLDQQAPAVPGSLSCRVLGNTLNLNWDRNNDDTVKYQVGYRSRSTSGVGQISFVSQPAAGTRVGTKIKDVLRANDIVVEIKAIDAAGNISALAGVSCRAD
ncbi:MAG TPA: IPT/TIG domain-containing protein [bacterium]|nr:IPT/TIG domain-containing protein [bacterium]